MQIDSIKQYEEYCQKTKAYLHDKEEWISFLNAFKNVFKTVSEKNSFSYTLGKALYSCLEYYIMSLETDEKNQFSCCMSEKDLNELLAQTIKMGRVLMDEPISNAFKKFVDLKLGNPESK